VSLRRKLNADFPPPQLPDICKFHAKNNDAQQSPSANHTGTAHANQLR
jgi:hypothetical protein